ncbi:DUF1648 domain-containing protein [Bacillus siamensis]|uniref:DUF1648 domain-containing protein n=1 Tax=Bacillus siamensis TaxID=659243 RepID=A0AAI8HLA4_9BACI|nr:MULTISPECIES: DUF1648 domain-containing protein [Bacillus]AME07519.1 hypothetical protein AUL54_14810 [Bacillus sp. SDLI1]AUJ76100.1 DUF1648 domain-containing protein [Bacillus siamensis]UUA83529.1 DUF1648 domain-containing protein [Bacillus siamensis]
MFLMNDKVLWGAVALAFILSIVFYPLLPADMAIHYDVSNRPNTAINKTAGVLILPVLMVVCMLFRKRIVQLFLVVYFLLIVHIAVLWLAL